VQKMLHSLKGLWLCFNGTGGEAGRFVGQVIVIIILSLYMIFVSLLVFYIYSNKDNKFFT